MTGLEQSIEGLDKDVKVVQQEITLIRPQRRRRCAVCGAGDDCAGAGQLLLGQTQQPPILPLGRPLTYFLNRFMFEVKKVDQKKEGEKLSLCCQEEDQQVKFQGHIGARKLQFFGRY